MRLTVEVAGQRSGIRARRRVVVDLSLAGAGIETDEPFVPGDRVSVTLATPTMWDPLVLEAVVAWAHPPRPARGGRRARPLPDRSPAPASSSTTPPRRSVLAMFEMLATLGYE